MNIIFTVSTNIEIHTLTVHRLSTNNKYLLTVQTVACDTRTTHYLKCILST